jgi:hypothetical protein
MECADDLARGVQSLNRLAIGVHHAGTRVYLRPAEGEHVGRDDRIGMEWRLVDRQRTVDFPIVDAFATSLATAELMVDLKRKLGLSVCRRGYQFTAPGKERMDQLLEFYHVGRGGT